jgi:hypothetical protein
MGERTEASEREKDKEEAFSSLLNEHKPREMISENLLLVRSSSRGRDTKILKNYFFI